MPTNKRMTPESRSKFFRLIGILVGSIGLIAGVIELGDYRERKKLEALNAQPLIEDMTLVSIAAGSAINPAVTIANRIVLDGGEFQFPENALWIANEIIMQSDTVLRGSTIAIVAKTVRGGRVDASGKRGELPGDDGKEGGRIAIAAKTLEGVKLIATGGDGVTGRPGERGTDGRAGRCDGFGRYRMAQVGGNGADGGKGGRGGAGGGIMVRFSEHNGVNIEADGGKGGHGGARGQGGRGGGGCMGLGGSQPTKPNGLDGRDGEWGDNGQALVIESHQIGYQALIDAVRPNLGNPSVILPLISKLLFQHGHVQHRVGRHVAAEPRR